jgi:hypothetical protein
MASFVKLNLDNIVIAGEFVSNEVIKDSNGVEQEQLGIDFLKTLYNEPNAIWKQTSYNNRIRKNYAGIGYSYDQTRDAFIAPKPFNSWILNESTCNWEAPVARPDDNNIYKWNEEILNWELMNG